MRISFLLKRQKALCGVCGKAFNQFDTNSWQIDHIKPHSLSGKDGYKNLQLVHDACHKTKTIIDIEKIRKTRLMDKTLQEPDQAKLPRPDFEDGVLGNTKLLV